MRYVKNVFTGFLSFALIFFFGTPAFADGGAGVRMEASSGGGKSTVSVVISGETDPEMIQFCMNYDPEKMECISTSAGEILSGNNAPLVNVNDGKIYFVWDSLDPIEEDGVLFQIEFKSIDDSEDADIFIETGKSFVIAGGDFKNVAPEKVQSVTVFEGKAPPQDVVINPNGSSSSGKNESSEPEIIIQEKEEETKEEKPSANSGYSESEKEQPVQNEDPEPGTEEPVQENVNSENEILQDENENVPNSVEVITNNRKEKSGAPIWLILLPIGAAVAGAVFILIKHRK